MASCPHTDITQPGRIEPASCEHDAPMVSIAQLQALLRGIMGAACGQCDPCIARINLADQLYCQLTIVGLDHDMASARGGAA